MQKFGIVIVTIVTFVGLSLLWSIIFAIPVWLLWNWIVPSVFGFAKLSLIKAWGLTFLTTLLFSKNVTVNKD